MSAPFSHSSPELCYLEAKRYPSRKQRALRFNFSAARYAYAFLFDPELGSRPSRFAPSFRRACDFYNRGLAWVVAYLAKLDREQGNRSVEGHRLLEVPNTNHGVDCFCHD